MENKHFAKALEALQENSIELSEYEIVLILTVAEVSGITSLKEIMHELERLHSMTNENDLLFHVLEILLEKLRTLLHMK